MTGCESNRVMHKSHPVQTASVPDMVGTHLLCMHTLTVYALIYCV